MQMWRVLGRSREDRAVEGLSGKPSLNEAMKLRPPCTQGIVECYRSDPAALLPAQPWPTMSYWQGPTSQRWEAIKSTSYSRWAMCPINQHLHWPVQCWVQGKRSNTWDKWQLLWHSANFLFVISNQKQSKTYMNSKWHLPSSGMEN